MIIKDVKKGDGIKWFILVCFLIISACKAEKASIQKSFGPDSVLVYGGAIKPDFKKALIQINSDGTGQYAFWMGEHGWPWRDEMTFTWKISNDSLYIQDVNDLPDGQGFPLGIIKGNKIIPHKDSFFGIRKKYILLTDTKQTAIKILKDGP
jgi:hypothetical protein